MKKSILTIALAIVALLLLIVGLKVILPHPQSGFWVTKTGETIALNKESGPNDISLTIHKKYSKKGITYLTVSGGVRENKSDLILVKKGEKLSENVDLPKDVLALINKDKSKDRLINSLPFNLYKTNSLTKATNPNDFIYFKYKQ